MIRDGLFLLPPGFEANGRREFCPECAELWGFLHYYPAILAAIEITYQPIDHPRPGLVALLGEGRWNCPTLILAPDAPGIEDRNHGDVKMSNGARFIDSARGVERYYASRFGVSLPRGS